MALALNLAVQVLTVRYLTKADYGAFAYALTAVAMGASLSVLGLEQTTSRFVAIYQEERDLARAAGAAVVAVVTVAAVGLALALLVAILGDRLLGAAVTDPLSLDLLLIAVALVPVQAVEAVLQELLAIFAGPRSVFLRRHVAGPGLRLAAVLLVITAGAGVRALAVATVAAGVAGLALYVTLLRRALRRAGLAPYFRPRALRLPTGEVLRFALPLWTTNLSYVFQTSLVVMLIEFFRGAEEVAGFRAVAPIAGLNLVVFQSFGLLYTPAAARLYARGDEAGANALYWRSTLWIAVATFPICVSTIALAEPMAVAFFGERYAASASVLAVLAVGNALVALLGPSGQTLRVHRRLRISLAADLLAAAAGLALCLVWIPRWGALGAAGASTAMFAVRKLVTFGALPSGAGVARLGPLALPTFASLVVAGAAVALVQHTFEPPFPVALGVVAAATALVIRVNRRALDVARTFPELQRLPLLGRLLAP